MQLGSLEVEQECRQTRSSCVHKAVRSASQGHARTQVQVAATLCKLLLQTFLRPCHTPSCCHIRLSSHARHYCSHASLASKMTEDEVAQLKAEGNALFQDQKFLAAAAVYTKAVKLQPDNAVLYRSALA